MIREYLDVWVYECNGCGAEIGDTEVIHRQELDYEHFCDECRPGCADCGANLTNEPRYSALDITPDGQPSWFRCRKCHTNRRVTRLLGSMGATP